MSLVQQEPQIWTGGALNIIKLIGRNSTFAQILGKLKKKKKSENLMNFENFNEKKNLELVDHKKIKTYDMNRTYVCLSFWKVQ